MLRKYIKNILIALAVILILMQFIRPEKNTGNGSGQADIAMRFPVNAEVDAVLSRSCKDCHSNHTEYPWYSNIQPVAWWLAEHIEDGKKHLNLSEFLNYRPYRQFHKLEEIEEVIGEEEMPLASYTVVHRNAVLDPVSRDLLIGWSRAMRDSMEVWYPADSLVKPSKK